MKLLLLVTGASRGLGRAISKAFCHQRSSSCRVDAILVARSLEGLQETARQIRQEIGVCDNGTSTGNRDPAFQVRISQHDADLSDIDVLDSKLDDIFMTIRDFSRIDNQYADGNNIICDSKSAAAYDRIVLVNNAGSLGHVGPCIDSPSLKQMRQSMDLNLTSTFWLTVRFLRFCNEHFADASNTTVVNISSLAAVQVFPTMGIYSSTKAARDSYNAAIAEEFQKGNRDSNNRIKFLNYAPGPLETEMTTQLRGAEMLDDNLKTFFSAKQEDPSESAQRLLKLVMDNEFESGAHIDFYDVNEEKKKE